MGVKKNKEEETFFLTFRNNEWCVCEVQQKYLKKCTTYFLSLFQSMQMRAVKVIVSQNIEQVGFSLGAIIRVLLLFLIFFPNPRGFFPSQSNLQTFKTVTL